MAGEGVFLLPFVLPRIFRPTILDVFNITNVELGLAFSIYGTIALFSYFLGGPLADRFSARKLMASAMVLTATGGILLQNIPGLKTFLFLYGFWGISTILLFWAAMLRYTRILGGSEYQGRAYGGLDAGRGLFAALLASVSIYIISQVLPSEPGLMTAKEKKYAIILIIRIYTGFVFILGVLIWILIPDESAEKQIEKSQRFTLSEIRDVISIPAIWLNAVIVLCAYVGYKCTDDFSLYAYDVFAYDDVQAAWIGNLSLWLRPVGAITAGYMADRLSGTKVIQTGFLITILFSTSIALGLIKPLGAEGLILNMALLSLGIYGIRGVYFALLNEGYIPMKYTGRAIGVISVIGFTPDVFMGPLVGYFLDYYPGERGHQYVFGILCISSLVGLIATLALRRINLRGENQPVN